MLMLMEKVKRIKKSKNKKVETPAVESVNCVTHAVSTIVTGVDVKFTKKAKKATMPVKAHATDAGFDMTAVSRTITEDYVEYDTGIAIAIPEGYVGLLFPRSSVSKYDLTLCNSVGCVDCGYSGNVKFRFKITKPAYDFEIKNRPWWSKITRVPTTPKIYQIGDKIGQLVIMKLPEINLVQVDTLDTTERGDGGFGSTGN